MAVPSLQTPVTFLASRAFHLEQLSPRGPAVIGWRVGLADGDIVTRELEYQTHGSAVVIALPDHADPATARAVGARIRDALGAGHRWIAVDLSAVHHMSTQTLSELCVALRRVGAAGRRLAVVGADLRVQWVLGLCEISGLELHRTIESAMQEV